MSTCTCGKVSRCQVLCWSGELRMGPGFCLYNASLNVCNCEGPYPNPHWNRGKKKVFKCFSLHRQRRYPPFFATTAEFQRSPVRLNLGFQVSTLASSLRAQSILSDNFPANIYMLNQGALNFGVYPLFNWSFSFPPSQCFSHSPQLGCPHTKSQRKWFLFLTLKHQRYHSVTSTHRSIKWQSSSPSKHSGELLWAQSFDKI